MMVGGSCIDSWPACVEHPASKIRLEDIEILSAFSTGRVFTPVSIRARPIEARTIEEGIVCLLNFGSSMGALSSGKELYVLSSATVLLSIRSHDPSLGPGLVQLLLYVAQPFLRMGGRLTPYIQCLSYVDTDFR